VFDFPIVKVDADKAARAAVEEEKRQQGQKKIQAKAALWNN
jgi:hypothetical protein